MGKELPGSHDVDSEPGSGREVADVEGNDEAAATGNRRLDHHVVLWIGQQRSPKEEDRLMDADLAQVVDERLDVGVCEACVLGVAKEGILILQRKRN